MTAEAAAIFDLATLAVLCALAVALWRGDGE